MSDKQPTTLAELLLRSLGKDNYQQERERIAREAREREERAAQSAADAETAERERQERIAASKALAPGIAIPVEAELPTVTFDPIFGTLVRVGGGDKAMAERLIGVEIQE